MAKARIPVDLFNPGQVFACLGFLEATSHLLGDADGAFDWSDESDTSFLLQTHGELCPITYVLDFLANADIQEIFPAGWPRLKADNSEESKLFPSPLSNHRDDSGEFKATKLPIRLVDTRAEGKCLDIQHWTDGSDRPDFKLYAGNRSGYSIARDMLKGKKSKPTKKSPVGKLLTLGIASLWKNQAVELKARPFDMLTEIGGSFNLDARGAWTPLDAGYSPDEQGHRLKASPVVEILAALALEHFRPSECGRGSFSYSVWDTPIPPQLARPFAAGYPVSINTRTFKFQIRFSGKNKIVSFAEEI